MKWQVLAAVAFVVGYGARGVIDAAGWPWWVSLLLYIPLGAMTWRWAKQSATKAKPTPAPDLRHLPSCPARLFVGVSDCKGCAPGFDRYGYGALLGNVYETPHVPRDQVIFAHPDLLQKLIRDAGPMLFEAPRINDNRHLPGCMKCHNPKAVCICGGRGFGLTPEVRGRMEFGPNFDREKKYLLECGHVWWSDDAPVGNCGKNTAEPGHRCTRPHSHLAKGDACMCGNCQATTIASWTEGSAP